jgi:hypothetical protein
MTRRGRPADGGGKTGLVGVSGASSVGSAVVQMMIRLPGVCWLGQAAWSRYREKRLPAGLCAANGPAQGMPFTQAVARRRKALLWVSVSGPERGRHVADRARAN